MSLFSRLRAIQNEIPRLRGPLHERHLAVLKELMASERIIDIGGGSPWKTGWLHKMYGDTLSKKGYCFDLDFSARPHVVADVHHVPLGNQSVDGVICNSVLEHVCEPRLVVNEIFRILKAGGRCYGSVPWIFPYHRCPKDYWRFSADGLQYLFRSFRQVEIFPRVEGLFRTVSQDFTQEIGIRLSSGKADLLGKIIGNLSMYLFALLGGVEGRDSAQWFAEFAYLNNSDFMSFFAVK